MKFLFLSVFALFLLSLQSDLIYLDKTEAQNAFIILNKIRLSPKTYAKDFKFNPRICPERPALIWNDTLAKIAEQKALDMATRNYFNHVDPKGYAMNYYINKGGYPLDEKWLKNKRDNFFESIAGNYDTGEQAIQALIIDKGEPSLGHRYHLLGHGEWNESLKDVGIGFARSGAKTKYATYICVLIAKHP